MIDLHTHSSCSDGRLDPQQLLDLASSAGLRLLSITDHDTVSAYRQTLSVPEQLTLIPGIELSSTWRGRGVHLVGLGVDPNSAAMQEAESCQKQVREARFEQICAALEGRGLRLERQAIRSSVGDTPGRPHIAAHLVETGQVKDMSKAFKRYLGDKRLPFAQSCWPDMSRCIGWITAAGGVAVLAHPLKYRLTGTGLDRLFEAFADCGGQAVEVLSGAQSDAEIAELSRRATRWNLIYSAGSDHHGPVDGKALLGVDPARVPRIEGLLQRLAIADICHGI